MDAPYIHNGMLSKSAEKEDILVNITEMFRESCKYLTLRHTESAAIRCGATTCGGDGGQVFSKPHHSTYTLA